VTIEPHDRGSTDVHLGAGPETRPLPVTDEFWDTIDERSDLLSGRLVTGMTVDTDWTSWEMHPAGDELIVVTAGTVHFHLDDSTATTELTVSAPEYLLVPAGTWHTADARGEARLLVVTWGEGTRHRSR
jgi:mannose-6-phosphate isomerase-like protein (cupin superfamily)